MAAWDVALYAGDWHILVGQKGSHAALSFAFPDASVGPSTSQFKYHHIRCTFDTTRFSNLYHYHLDLQTIVLLSRRVVSLDSFRPKGTQRHSYTKAPPSGVNPRIP